MVRPSGTLTSLSPLESPSDVFPRSNILCAKVLDFLYLCMKVSERCCKFLLAIVSHWNDTMAVVSTFVECMLAKLAMVTTKENKG